MRFPGRRRLASFHRWLRSRARARTLVLGYHRVADVDDDPLDLAVSPENFAAHMERVAALDSALRLREMGESLAASDGPASGVVVTFDDGYRDNLYAAKPILERLEIPATVFVISGSVGRRFWWCELERAPHRSSAELIELPLPERDGGRAVRYRSNDRRERSEALAEAARRLADAAPRQREAALSRIVALPGALPDREEARAMDAAELLSLVQGGLVEIGAHTVTHPRLETLTLAEQRREIVGSRDDLAGLGLPAPKTFSYPNGTFGAGTAGLVRDAGFVAACTSEPDVGSAIHDRFHIPRFFVPNVSGDEFGRFLGRWL